MGVAETVEARVEALKIAVPVEVAAYLCGGVSMRREGGREEGTDAAAPRERTEAW